MKELEQSRSADPGLTCKHCGGSAFRVRRHQLEDGPTKLHLVCARCKSFARWLRATGAPPVAFEPKPPDGNPRAAAAPPKGWRWIGFLRQDDGLWRPVAEAPTLARCWEGLLHHPGEGDRLCVPSRPGYRFDEERA